MCQPSVVIGLIVPGTLRVLQVGESGDDRPFVMRASVQLWTQTGTLETSRNDPGPRTRPGHRDSPPPACSGGRTLTNRLQRFQVRQQRSGSRTRESRFDLVPIGDRIEPVALSKVRERRASVGQATTYPAREISEGAGACAVFTLSMGEVTTSRK